jgi:RNA polymerase sigma-70 factor (ECF subfamily)
LPALFLPNVECFSLGEGTFFAAAHLKLCWRGRGVRQEVDRELVFSVHLNVTTSGYFSVAEPRLSDQPADSSNPKRYELIDPDVRLMLQVRDDNAAAFEQLVEQYRNRLLHVLEHLVPGRGVAEDLVQEVFMRVYRARKTYAPNAKFSTWLYTIADNVANNALRGASHRKEVQLQGASSTSTSMPSLENMAKEPSRFMPARRADQAELAEMVRKAVQSLSERQRMALLLCKFEHMSYEDVAKAMNLSTKAVKSLLSRARNNLREMLEPYVHAGGLPFGLNESSDPSETDLAAAKPNP